MFFHDIQFFVSLSFVLIISIWWFLIAFSFSSGFSSSEINYALAFQIYCDFLSILHIDHIQQILSEILRATLFAAATFTFLSHSQTQATF
jgi:hypothetical protein